MISIHMLKICEIIFKSCLGQVIFPSERKKVNAVPIYKKNYKQGIENYQPVSLLPTCSKIFELIIYDCFLICWKITSSENQSGFKPSDSCINEFRAITHEIYSSFDDNQEERGIFLDISKAFEKVWHEGIIHKLQQTGISDNLLNLSINFLKNQKQRVVLRRHCYPGLMQMLVSSMVLFQVPFFSLSIPTTYTAISVYS